MRLFYLEAEYGIGDEITLNKEHSHRLLNILRMKVGEEFPARDQKRNLYTVSIVNIKNKLAVVKILKKEAYPTQTTEVILWQAVPKHPRFAQAVQLAVEAGVTRIVPIISDYCQVSQENCLDKFQRWNRVAAEAVDQSGNRDFLQIDPIMKLEQALHQKQSCLGFFCHQNMQKQPALRQILSRENLHLPIILAVGPEGGFSPKEVQDFQQASFHAICFYDTILRSENAGLFFLAALKMTLQELKESYGEIPRPAY